MSYSPLSWMKFIWKLHCYEKCIWHFTEIIVRVWSSMLSKPYTCIYTYCIWLFFCFPPRLNMLQHAIESILLWRIFIIQQEVARNNEQRSWLLWNLMARTRHYLGSSAIFFKKKAMKPTTYLEISQTFSHNYYNKRQKTKTPFRCSYIWNNKCSNSLVLCRHCMFSVAFCREKAYNVLCVCRIPHEPRNR